MDGPFCEPDDIAGLIEETETFAAMGFTGKAFYDAQQIPHIHSVFTPDANAIDYARRVKSADKILETAKRRGVL